MQYTVDVTMDCPRDKVVEMFMTPELAKEWQEGLKEMTPLTGTPGEVGSTARLSYQMGKRELTMVETITEKNLPDSFVGTYETDGVWNEVRNEFVEVDGGKTQWICHNTFKFSSFPMKVMGFLMPGMFKKQSLKMMEAFKAMAEKRSA